MKTYIIHLERAKARREHIDGLVAEHDLNFEIIKAFDCINLKDSDYEAFCDVEMMKQHPTWLTPGMVCACYTHYLTYKKILEDGVDFGFIIEDDVLLPDGINGLLDEIGRSMSVNEAVMLHFLTFSPLRLTRTNAVELGNGYQLLDAEGRKATGSAAGYIISREAAKTMSDFVLPVRNGTDSWEAFLLGGAVDNVRYVFPMPVQSVGFKSTVQAVVQSSLRAKLTSFIDDNRIPPFFQVLRALRKKSITDQVDVTID